MGNSRRRGGRREARLRAVADERRHDARQATWHCEKRRFEITASPLGVAMREPSTRVRYTKRNARQCPPPNSGIDMNRRHTQHLLAVAVAFTSLARPDRASAQTPTVI